MSRSYEDLHAATCSNKPTRPSKRAATSTMTASLWLMYSFMVIIMVVVVVVVVVAVVVVHHRGRGRGCGTKVHCKESRLTKKEEASPCIWLKSL